MKEIRRELYLDRIRPFYDSDLIKILVGIRRCGKSVILKQIQKEISNKQIDSKHIIYIKEKIIYKKKYYIFIDEIQYVKSFEKAINSLNTKYNLSIFITGSNSRL